MKNTAHHTVCLALVLLVLVFAAAPAGAFELGIGSAKKTGTYYNIGLDLRALGRDNGFDIVSYPSQGSLENVELLQDDNFVDMAVVQYDVIMHIKMLGDSKHVNIQRNIRSVLPLYIEEVHILARKDITAFEQLDGKRLAVDSKMSGTYMTAMQLFFLSKITPGGLYNVGVENALEALNKGEVDAMVYVVGAPATIFTELPDPERYNLIPVTDERVYQFYPRTTIRAGVYPWLKKDTPTVSVPALLAATSQLGEKCDHVRYFSEVIKQNVGWLQQHGHPKWRNVNFDAELFGWTPLDCSE